MIEQQSPSNLDKLKLKVRNVCKYEKAAKFVNFGHGFLIMEKPVPYPDATAILDGRDALVFVTSRGQLFK
jgi:hypothetical protein